MKNFTKTVENFTCLHCGANVVGTGYTNHCPKCLWSRDVDINPGDRAGKCGGMMRPVSATSERGRIIITHRCEKCGKIKRQRVSDDDDHDAIIALSANPDFIFGK
ncbi:MAG: RNHCP domain-containing protein [Rickettsiales bacterium]|nr:RNHCP domain-containing protein [Rickettsiales bacterium]